MKVEARRGLARGGPAIALSVVVELAFAAAAPHVPWPPAFGFAIAFAAIGASVIGVSLAVGPLPPKTIALALVPAAMLWLVRDPSLPLVGRAAIITFALLMLGAVVGSVIGARVQHVGHTLVIAYVGSAADVFSVFHASGVTAQIAARPEVLSLVAIPWPVLGTDAIEPMLGVGDVVMAALYGAIAKANGLSLRRTGIAMAAAFGVVLVLLFVLQIALPVLPFLGVAMLIAHPEMRVVPIKDRTVAFVGMTVVTLVFVGLAFSL